MTNQPIIPFTPSIFHEWCGFCHFAPSNSTILIGAGLGVDVSEIFIVLGAGVGVLISNFSNSFLTYFDNYLYLFLSV